MTPLEFFKTYGYLIGYFLFLLVYAVFILTAFYHAWEYGYAGDASKVVMISFAVISLGIAIFTFILVFSF
jgi:hypothetical protein